jgi:hypothetical protein
MNKGVVDDYCEFMQALSQIQDFSPSPESGCSELHRELVIVKRTR